MDTHANIKTCSYTPSLKKNIQFNGILFFDEEWGFTAQKYKQCWAVATQKIQYTLIVVLVP